MALNLPILFALTGHVRICHLWKVLEALTRGNNRCFIGKMDQLTNLYSKDRPGFTEVISALRRELTRI